MMLVLAIISLAIAAGFGFLAMLASGMSSNPNETVTVWPALAALGCAVLFFSSWYFAW